MIGAGGLGHIGIQVLRGRGEAYISREQRLAATQADLDKSKAAFIGQLQESEASARATLERERGRWGAERTRWDAERSSLAENRDEGWDLGRGMEDRAHWYRHELISLAMRFNALLDLFANFVAGRLEHERAVAILAQTKRAEDPPSVPPLREVGRKKAA